MVYEFWYGYIKPKHDDKIKLCYTDTDSFVIEVETEDLYADISDDVKKWYDTFNYDKDDNRPLPLAIKKKNYQVYLRMNLGVKIMTEFWAIRAKTYAFAVVDGKKNERE